MSVTTSPRTVETTPGDGGDGYGDLDERRGSAGRGGRWAVLLGAVLAILALGAIAFRFVSGGEDDEASPATSSTTTITTVQPATTSSSIDVPATDPPVELEINGWVLSNEASELPEYVDSPLINDEGSVEGDIEVAFVNSEIASMRALANPSVEEPELSFWKSGFTLSAAREVQDVLVEDGQVLLPGALTRVEIESITVRSDTEADVEYCALIHDYNVVVENTDDRIESLVTRHAINRMIVGPAGQWQNSELISEIQVVDGPGPCLDVDLTPVG